jgi:hypothetical protein
MNSPHAVFLDGEWSLSGFRRYYLLALAYKLPHFVQFLLIVALVGCLRPENAQRRRLALFVLLPAGLLLAFASLSSMQLGLRYVLPAIPALLLVASSAAAATPDRRGAHWFVSAALAVLAFSALRHHPHHLAYFNELAGGPEGGRTHLVDSNLDWGQDLNLVKRWMDENRVDQIGLAYFGSLRPEVLGIRYTTPPGGQPAPGWYAVSVNFVMGRPYTIPAPDGGTRAVNLYEYAYFGAFPPVARLGYSIDVYHLTASDVREWQRQAEDARY